MSIDREFDDEENIEYDEDDDFECDDVGEGGDLDDDEERDDDLDDNEYDDDEDDEDDYDEYDDDEDEYDDDEDDDEIDFGISKEGVAQVTDDFNTIYKEGAAAAKELKDAFADIKSAFNFKDIFK